MSKRLVLVVLFVTALGMGGTAMAQPYVAPGDITSSESDFAPWPDYSASKLVDQTPMDFSDPANPLGGWDAGNYYHSMSSTGYTSPASGNTVDHWWRFDFSGPTAITEMMVWNGAANLPDRAPKDVEIFVTQDSGATWSLLTAAVWAHTEAIANYPRLASDVVDFGGLTVDGVVVDIISDWGDPDNWCIASEILFEEVPEPATMTLLGLGGLALIRRKRVR